MVFFLGKHDVDMPDDEDLSWERIEENACLLGVDDNPNRDCDILNQFFSYILKRWGRALNSRDELTKRCIIQLFIFFIEWLNFFLHFLRDIL